MKNLIFIFFLMSCQPPLEHQPRFNTFTDITERPLGVVDFYKASTVKPRLDFALLQRGRDRYEIHCAVCHGLAGQGDGLLTQRGFHPIKAFDQKTVESLYKVISDGKEDMPSFKGRMDPRDRWALAHYVLVLVLRNHAEISKLSQPDILQIEEGAK